MRPPVFYAPATSAISAAPASFLQASAAAAPVWQRAVVAPAEPRVAVAEAAPVEPQAAAVAAHERPAAVAAAVAAFAPVVAAAASAAGPDAPAWPAAAVLPDDRRARRRRVDADRGARLAAQAAVRLVAERRLVVVVVGRQPAPKPADVVARRPAAEVAAILARVAARLGPAVVVAAAPMKPVHPARRAAGVYRGGRVRPCRAAGALAPRPPAGSRSSSSAPR